MNWSPYVSVLLASAKQDSANPKRLATAIAVSLFRIFLLAMIYRVAFRTSEAALSYENTIWSFGLYFTFIINLGIRQVFTLVENEVQTGNVEVQIVKPLDWRLMKIAELIGRSSLEFISQLIIVPIFLLLLVGPPDISHFSVPFVGAFILLTIFAIVSASYLFMSIGLSAFWLNDAKSVFRIFDKLVLIFGGAYVPIALLPLIVQSVVRMSPFGVYAAPTQLFNPDIASHLFEYVLSAFFWTILLIVISNSIWRRVERRIEVNGG